MNEADQKAYGVFGCGVFMFALVFIPYLLLDGCIASIPTEAERVEAMTPGERKTHEDEKRYGKGLEAKIYSEDFARQRMTYPKEAKFDGVFTFNGRPPVLTNGVWLVNGSGFTKNGFGVKVGFTYTARMQKAGRGWRCLAVNVIAQ